MNLTELLGTDSLIDSKDLLQLLVRLGFNLVVTSAIVGLYYRLYRNREFVFTYFVFNVITFTLCTIPEVERAHPARDRCVVCLDGRGVGANEIRR